MDCDGKRSATPLSPRTETEANEENEGSVLRFLCCLLSNTSGRKRRRRCALPAQSKTWRLLFACLLLSTLNLQLSTLLAQGTAFTYQGRLSDNGSPASGIYDLRFEIYESASGGDHLGNTLAAFDLAISNGLFTVLLDFGEAFPGADRWLEISVRPGASTGSFSNLVPRQRLTATPYAITAGNVASNGLASGTYASAVTFNNPANSFTGGFTGNGTGLTNVNAGTLGGLGSSNFWQLAGNSGTTPGTHFLGTADNQPLELRVNSARALRLEPRGGAAPSLVGGYLQNSVAGYHGAAVAGGGTSGSPNYALGHYAFVGAGHGGQAADYSAVVAGAYNVSPGQLSFIGSGQANTNQANYAFIGGGTNNLILANADYSAISAGQQNVIRTNSRSATIAGGRGGGIGANSGFSAIGGGYSNNVAGESLSGTIAGGIYNDIGAFSGSCAIGGGSENKIATFSGTSTIAGGAANGIGTSSRSSAIGGGSGNNVADNSPEATIAGGYYNDIGAGSPFSTIGGGYDNNVADNADYGTVAGGTFNNIGTRAFYSAISGGYSNNVAVDSGSSTIAGGYYNNIGAGSTYSTIGGGRENNIAANSRYATIPGGANNFAATYAFAAGRRAKAVHTGAFVWADSTDDDFASTANDQFCIRAAGGVGIGTNAPNSTLHVQGSGNRAAISAYSPTINSAVYGENTSGNGGFGVSGRTTGSGYAVYGDNVNAAGWAGYFNGNVRVTGTLNPPSDRHVKRDFECVNAREVLEKVAALSIQTWAYTNDTAGARHLGPVAQDFKAAFGLGADDKHIATVDADGVALAAIQGLNQKLTEELEQKATEITELKERLQRLEQHINQTNKGTK
jgi:hypothetical protein